MTPQSPQQRLQSQLHFVMTLDRLKTVLRKTRLADGSRWENSAEHSWHLATMALVFQEYAPPTVDLQRVLPMVLIHDVVEIEAGDTFCYDPETTQDQAAREQAAADSLFHQLPRDQAHTLRALWEEFEAGTTPTAQFAIALDRLHPFLLNYANEGATWKQFAISADQVWHRMQPIKAGFPEMWPFVTEIIAECVSKGIIQHH